MHIMENFFAGKASSLFIGLLFCTLCLTLSGCREGEDETAESSLPPYSSEEPARENEAGEKEITAVFHTSLGKISCILYPEQAPLAVANFISLARGTKKWTHPQTGNTVSRPLFDGTVFHRVIPAFMIQGGDPLGTGFGGPGYRFQDEFSENLKFDAPGILAMANSGPDTNGSQFFITVAPTPWLNNRHTIFGKVISGQEVVQAISRVDRDSQDRPLVPVILEKVEIIDKQ